MKAEKGLEPVGFVMGWHVTVGDPHTDVRLDVRLYSGRRHQFKAGDHIYAHLPTSEWNDALEAAAAAIAPAGVYGAQAAAAINAIRRLKREPR